MIQPQPAFRAMGSVRASHFSLLGFSSQKCANFLDNLKEAQKMPKNSPDFWEKSGEMQIDPKIRRIFGTRLRAIKLSRFRRCAGLVRDVCRSACLLACLLACLPVCVLACLPACPPACLPACPSHKILNTGLKAAVGDWDPLLYNKRASWLWLPPLRYIMIDI